MPAPRYSPRIKICGHTRLADAVLSVELGADMIGVVIYEKSKRHVPLERALEWIGQVPRGAERVAVFVDPTLDDVRAALAEGNFDAVQLHGSELPEFFAALNAEGCAGRLIKAARVKNAASIEALADYPTERFLLDGPEPGSGHVFDWELAAHAVMARRLPETEYLLAGGLTPENVAEAIASVQPQGVDVASGVESSPGIKDPEKLRRFIEAARAAHLPR